jgi:glutathione S-transferase
MTWAWMQPDGQRGHETVVDVSFEKVERGTRMTLVHQTFTDAEQTRLHNQGWTSSLEKLVRLFE